MSFAVMGFPKMEGIQERIDLYTSLLPKNKWKKIQDAATNHLMSFEPEPWRVFSYVLNALVVIIAAFELYKKKFGFGDRELTISAKHNLLCLWCIVICHIILVPQIPMLYHLQDNYHPNYRSLTYQCLDMATTVSFAGIVGVLPFASCYRYVRLLGAEPSARLLLTIKLLKVAVVLFGLYFIVAGVLNNFFDPDELSEVETWPETLFTIGGAVFGGGCATIDLVMNIKMSFHVLSRMSIHAAASAQNVKGTFSIKRALQLCFGFTVFLDIVAVASFLLDNTGGFMATSLSALHAMSMFKLLYYIKKGSEIEVNLKIAKAKVQKRKQLKKEERLEMEQIDTSEVSGNQEVIDSVLLSPGHTSTSRSISSLKTSQFNSEP